jgi:16S rRNA (guanine527-N7)-methyltransferase
MNRDMTDRIEFSASLKKCFGENCLEEYYALEEQLYRLTRLLLEYNAHTNLTAITEPGDIISKHYADSLAVCRYIPPCATLIDVGAGAGFPSLPIAAARPDVRVTALDSTAKKLDFIDRAAAELGIGNITTLCGRAETLACDSAYRERFDTATARAVARLGVLYEICLPFVAVGGKFIAMKGPGAETELSESADAMRVLGGAMAENIPGTLIAGDSIQKRYTIIIQKDRETPKNYPRNWSQINKKPL